MPRVTYNLLDREYVRILKGPFTITSQDGRVSAKYGMNRGWGKAIVLLGDLKVGEGLTDQRPELILRAGLYQQHYENGGSPESGLEKLREFARWAIKEGPWQGAHLDGGEIQEKAAALGLITKHIATAENKADWENIEHVDEGSYFFNFKGTPLETKE